MSFDEFLTQLELEGYRVKGRSFAFRDFEDWVVAFLRLGGRNQLTGKVSFVLCARPNHFLGLEEVPLHDSTEPHDYPLKLVLDDVRKGVRYESRLLKFKHDVIALDSDWSVVYSLLNEDLPEQLKSPGVSGLREQIGSQEKLDYVEKIWLAEGVDT